MESAARVQGSGFRALLIEAVGGIRVSGVWFMVSDFGFRVSGSGRTLRAVLWAYENALDCVVAHTRTCLREWELVFGVWD